MKVSLLDTLYRSRTPHSRIFEINDIKKVVTVLCQAVSCLHDHGYVHGDLKLENILLDEEGNLKLSDFGHTFYLQKEFYSTSFNIQTPNYRAPEVFCKAPYNHLIDMWSIGCIAAELFQGSRFFSGNSDVEILRAIIDTVGKIPFHLTIFHPPYILEQVARNFKPGEVFPKITLSDRLLNARALHCNLKDSDYQESKKIITLIKGLLKIDPMQRLSAKEALSLLT